MNRLTVCIGDVHGCLEELQELLKLISYNPEQVRLVMLGDLMDRGPDSVGCVRLVRELGLDCIKGNHEDKHVRWRKNEIKKALTGKENPMKKLSKVDRKAHDGLTDDDIQWMKNLPIKLDLENGYWAVHAGCEPYRPLADQSHDQLMRVRYVNTEGKGVPLNPDKTPPKDSVYWTERWQGPESIIYGHCVHNMQEIRMDVSNNVSCIGIDTGCCFGGYLTAALFKEQGVEFVQVKAKQKYHSRSGEEQ